MNVIILGLLTSPLTRQLKTTLILLISGNIRVFCRIRPKIAEDMNGPSAELVVSCDKADDAIVHVAHKGRLNSFELDRVFQSHATQKEVSVLLVSMGSQPDVCKFVAVFRNVIHRTAIDFLLYCYFSCLLRLWDNSISFLWAAVFTFNPYLLVSIIHLLISIMHL